MTTATQITKDLKKAGFEKAGSVRINFQTIQTGNFETRLMNKFGLNLIMVTPKNGTKAEELQAALLRYNAEIKNGYVVIKL